MRLIFASGNQNKIREIKEILPDTYKNIAYSLKDLNVSIDPEENGTTYEENADIKVRVAFDTLKNSGILTSGDIVIADDTGLSIESLDGAPGINSARFMGKETRQDIKNKKILELLKNEKNRTATFTTVLSVLFYNSNDTTPLHFRGDIDGTIAHNIEGSRGFGYDPIFQVNGISYSNMGEDGKNELSHRKVAITKFIEYIEGTSKNIGF